MDLNPREHKYYSRQISLKDFGLDGQKKLKNASVLCIGAGGLGSSALMYLAGSGIGTLGIIDFDSVDITNLHRQVLHSSNDKGQLKVRSALKRLNKINPNININSYAEKLNIDNIEFIFKNYDIIVDGTDNFNTRYLVNDACVLMKKTLIFGSVFRFEGQVSVFDSRKGPCYRCLYPIPPDPTTVTSCADDGILGVLPGIVGTLQANEAIKLITGIGESLIGRFLTLDLKSMLFNEHKLNKNPNCPICSKTPSISSLKNEEIYCQMVQPFELSFHAFLELEKTKETILIDIRNAYELKGTSVENALHIPMDELESKLPSFKADDYLVLVCQKGQRSLRMASRLRDQHKHIYSLQNGINVLTDRFTS